MALSVVPRLESTPVASEICPVAHEAVTHQLDLHSGQERLIRRTYVQAGLVHSWGRIPDPDVKKLHGARTMSLVPSKEIRPKEPTTVLGGGQVPGVRDQTSVLTASGAVLQRTVNRESH